MQIVDRQDYTGHRGRIFAVGDIHGMFHALERLLEEAEFDPRRDILWSLGDLVDRGPLSHRCLDLLIQPWFRAVRGNHEALMLDSGGDYATWLQWTINGGEWSLGYPWDAAEVVERISALPWAAELITAVGKIGLVHADVDRTLDWPGFLEALEEPRGLARHVALWSRSSANQAGRGQPGRQIAGADLVLVGHSIVAEAFQWGNMWFLDSGAVVTDDPSAALSMLEIHPEQRLWSVSTAGDALAAEWWGLLSERLAAVLERVRGIASAGP